MLAEPKGYKEFLPFCKGENGKEGKKGAGKEGKRMVWIVRKRRKKQRMVNKKEKPREGRGSRKQSYDVWMLASHPAKCSITRKPTPPPLPDSELSM